MARKKAHGSKQQLMPDGSAEHAAKVRLERNLSKGRRIEASRVMAGIVPQAELARRLGVSAQRLNLWTTGRVAVPEEFILSISSTCDVTPEYIMFGDDTKLPKDVRKALAELERSAVEFDRLKKLFGN